MLRYLLLLSACVFFYEKTSAQDSIPWCDTCKLTWADFRGQPDAGSPYKAITTARISYSVAGDTKGKLTVAVTCSFQKSASWKKDEPLNDYLLQHEQLHFDISELFTRKIRKQLGEYTATHTYKAGVMAEIKTLFAQMNKQKDLMNDQYDAETDHSLNTEQQAAWNKRVAEELASLEAYKM